MAGGSGSWKYGSVVRCGKVILDRKKGAVGGEWHVVTSEKKEIMNLQVVTSFNNKQQMFKI